MMKLYHMFVDAWVCLREKKLRNFSLFNNSEKFLLPPSILWHHIKCVCTWESLPSSSWLIFHPALCDITSITLHFSYFFYAQKGKLKNKLVDLAKKADEKLRSMRKTREKNLKKNFSAVFGRMPNRHTREKKSRIYRAYSMFIVSRLEHFLSILNYHEDFLIYT